MVVLVAIVASPGGLVSFFPIRVTLTGAAIAIGAMASTAYGASVRKRFHSERAREMWETCRDRLVRFEDVAKRARKEKVGGLNDLPLTVRKIADSLYFALRRADSVRYEVERTESELSGRSPGWLAGTKDPQSQELYRLAEKNLAEYRLQYAEVMASVQRTEAQAALYTTTLDALRIKLLGYRLSRNPANLPSDEFLVAMTDAKLQLESIDKALEELELSPFPKMIAAMPNPQKIESEDARQDV